MQGLFVRLPGAAAGTLFRDSDGVTDVLMLNRFGEPWMTARLSGTNDHKGTGVLNPVALPDGPYIGYRPWAQRVAEDDFLIGRRGTFGWNGLSCSV